MPNRYGPLQWLARLAKTATVTALIAVALAMIVTVAFGILEFHENGNLLTSALYLLAVIAEVALALAIIVAYGCVLTRASASVAVVNLNGQIKRLQTLLQATEEKFDELTDLGSLSDQAKAMIYHDREIEAVQEIVNACLLRQDYDQAEMLITRMEEQTGYRDEAARLRAAVSAARQAGITGQITAAVERVNTIIAQRNWARAAREAQRLTEAFGDNEQVVALTGRITTARNQHKTDLLQQYDQAVQRNDVDRSIELLRELDRYLTAPEAAALQESARGVFRAKLHNLGVQFAIAVTEERWNQAVTVGEEIAREFPNSRMATEVAQKLEALRQLAQTKAAQ